MVNIGKRNGQKDAMRRTTHRLQMLVVGVLVADSAGLGQGSCGRPGVRVKVVAIDAHISETVSFNRVIKGWPSLGRLIIRIEPEMGAVVVIVPTNGFGRNCLERRSIGISDANMHNFLSIGSQFELRDDIVCGFGVNFEIISCVAATICRVKKIEIHGRCIWSAGAFAVSFRFRSRNAEIFLWIGPKQEIDVINDLRWRGELKGQCVLRAISVWRNSAANVRKSTLGFAALEVCGFDVPGAIRVK
jgi:hypothetical protein